MTSYDDPLALVDGGAAGRANQASIHAVGVLSCPPPSCLDQAEQQRRWSPTVWDWLDEGFAKRP